MPFRDSKLTRLLTDSLGGNTKTALCACVGPALHNYDETFCTLLLATRAMAVKNHATVNERIERGSAEPEPENEPASFTLTPPSMSESRELEALRQKRSAAPNCDALSSLTLTLTLSPTPPLTQGRVRCPSGMHCLRRCARSSQR